MSGYHKDKGPKRLTIQVDIAKAFDSIRWEFIFQCLSALNLPPLYVKWIMECITTPSFSVGINDSIHGYFRGTRGLRQGDPLSPYLFGLAMNVLSHMLNKAAEENKFGYPPNRSESRFTHLCFGDDLLIFSDGSLTSVHGILTIRSDFQRMSGLAISPVKSCFFSAGLSTQELTSIATSSNIPQGHLPIRYLGLPLCTKKSFQSSIVSLCFRK